MDTVPKFASGDLVPSVFRGLSTTHSTVVPVIELPGYILITRYQSLQVICQIDIAALDA
jgi:hypothetical protein